MNKYFNEHTTVVLTGASSGIGKCLAEILTTKYNAKVIGIGRNEEKLSSVKSLLGDNFTPYKMDVSIKAEWERLSLYLQSEKITPNALINCAGVLPKFSKFNKSVSTDAKAVMDINFFSIVYSSEIFIPILKKAKKPIIINVLSSSALCPFAGVSLYSSSKSAGVRFSECLGFENKDILVSTVMPGFTKTDVMRNQNATDKERGIIDKISAPANRVANKILKRASKGKKRVIIGFDAHLMNLLYKFFPRTAPRLIGWFLKKTKMKLFEEI